MNVLPLAPRVITQLPATGRAPQFFTTPIQTQTHTLPGTGARFQPLFGFELPGKGIVKTLNNLLFGDPNDPRPKLPPIIPPEATAAALIALRNALGPEKFFKAAGILFKVAVGGSVSEAIGGVVASETIEPLHDLAELAKALFLPHHEVEFKPQLFTSGVERRFNNVVSGFKFIFGSQAERDRQILESLGTSPEQIRDEAFAKAQKELLGELLAQKFPAVNQIAPDPKFVLDPEALAIGFKKSQERFIRDLIAAGALKGDGSLLPLPGEGGDP